MWTRTEPSLRDLMRLSASACGVEMTDFISHRRAIPMVRTRHIYFALARELTTKSFPQIGNRCGDRDHTTVMHGVEKVARMPWAFEPEISVVRAAAIVLEDSAPAEFRSADKPPAEPRIST